MDSFTIDLMSNSSMKVFENNTTSNFTVLLPKKIVLKGDWQVALTEIQLPNCFNNVTKHNNRIIFEELKPNNWYFVEGKTYELKHSNYKNIQEIVNELNEGFLQVLEQKIFEYDKETNKINITISKAKDVRKILYKNIYLENKLALQLGFTPGANILQYTKSPNPVEINHGLFDYVMVYCDIIESQIISDTYAQVIKVFTRENISHEKTVFSKEFHNLEFVPVVKKEFDTVEINLRTITGNFMPFIYGISNLKLHFKKY